MMEVKHAAGTRVAAESQPPRGRGKLVVLGERMSASQYLVKEAAPPPLEWTPVGDSLDHVLVPVD
jgi:hypothetical protein